MTNNPLSYTDTNQNPNKPLNLGDVGTKPKARRGGKGKYYTVKTGDSYASIAQELFGDQRYFNVIADLFGGQTIHAGMELKIPNVEQYKPPAGQLHYVSPGEFNAFANPSADSSIPYVRALAQNRPAQVSTVTTPPTLTNPGTAQTQGASSPNVPVSTPYLPPTTGVAMPPGYLNYSALAAQPVSDASYSFGAHNVVPPTAGYYGSSTYYKRASKVNKPIYQYNARAAQAAVQPPLDASGAYTGVGMPSYGAPVTSQGVVIGNTVPATTGYYGAMGSASKEITKTGKGSKSAGVSTLPSSVPPPANPQTPLGVTGNQQVLPQVGMTGAQTALALESGIANKPAGTYQVQRTYQRPIYSQTETDVWGQPKIIGFETVPYSVNGSDTINVGATGYKPASYVGFTGDVLNGGKPGQGRIIGGGEGFVDYTPAGIPKPPGTPYRPTGGGWGGGGGGGRNGGGRGGGGGGGGPNGGGGRGYATRSTPAPVYAQANTLPGGSTRARDMAGLSRTGLVTWRL